MLKESFVFRGKDGVHQIRRQVVVAHRTAFLSGAVKKIGNQLRFNLRPCHFGSAAEWADGFDGLSAKLDLQRVASGKIRELGRTDPYDIVRYRKNTKSSIVGFRTIADPLQVSGQLLSAQGFARVNLAGRRKNLRGIL